MSSFSTKQTALVKDFVMESLLAVLLLENPARESFSTSFSLTDSD
jgi:hypothetical protein